METKEDEKIKTHAPYRFPRTAELAVHGRLHQARTETTSSENHRLL